jgi:hypothetical protein
MTIILWMKTAVPGGGESYCNSAASSDACMHVLVMYWSRKQLV